jgi:hypothetical protein
MDNCPGPLTNEVRDLLNTARVTVSTFAPHTTQIFQLPELTLFEMFKRERNYHLPFSDLETTVNVVHKVYLKMAKILTPQHMDSISSNWSHFLYRKYPLRYCLSSGKVEGIKGTH